MSGLRLKVLCLHGFTSNGTVHAHQLRTIVKALPEYEFVFPDGPHKVNIDSEWDLTKPEVHLWNELVISKSTSGHRAWWYAREGKEKGAGDFVGLNASLDFIGSLMQKEGPFHAILGFSQGGCFAGILCALLQRRSIAHPLRSHLPEKLPSPLAGIIFSGFKVRFPQYDEVYAEGINIPMIHVMGVEDDDVIVEKSEELASLNTCSEILKHNGGHQIPRKPEDISQITSFFRKHILAAMILPAQSLI
ncbi:MAG: hypothetical protein GOMPHAMPRED_008125 [Gomphillus americanus]|uniref:Serine hydrolase domain-containing protein n=1 Tax=Gomphillus americanus TaxID=1940652 RepID=A0A8H3F4Q8_9LECA|nr:MAG: hypothetical protein GOMPHAMPRED_008125 [Gomphillus americanus]